VLAGRSGLMVKLSGIIKFMGNHPVWPCPPPIEPENGPSLATLSLRETLVSRLGTGEASGWTSAGFHPQRASASAPRRDSPEVPRRKPPSAVSFPLLAGR